MYTQNTPRHVLFLVPLQDERKRHQEMENPLAWPESRQVAGTENPKPHPSCSPQEGVGTWHRLGPPTGSPEPAQKNATRKGRARLPARCRQPAPCMWPQHPLRALPSALQPIGLAVDGPSQPPRRHHRARRWTRDELRRLDRLVVGCEVCMYVRPRRSSGAHSRWAGRVSRLVVHASGCRCRCRC